MIVNRKISTFALALILIVVTGGIWGFVELADEVVEGQTQSFDERILLALRSPADPADPIGPAWVEEICRCMATCSMRRQTSINWPHREFSSTMPTQHLYALPQEPVFKLGSTLPGWGFSILFPVTGARLKR